MEDPTVKDDFSESKMLRTGAWRCAQVLCCSVFVMWSIPLIVIAPVGFVMRVRNCLYPSGVSEADIANSGCSHIVGLLRASSAMIFVMLASLVGCWAWNRAHGRDITDLDRNQGNALEPSDGYVELLGPGAAETRSRHVQIDYQELS
eukprot:TRINITY_DN45248_c0_g1_i1.p1 TRINITY_DN45248_c0_g1~~TRINITY_DN45248_c0_g1_i1.p1  ORF type:complete len:147 (-),score=15.39 TRINITY_DN45248_c0_g1_i1:79-519(-)